jgi:replication fork protection complex subunit Csm3/Swi3
LFPKAKFLDALTMVEKMGHKKRIQVMRMEWINEGKPFSEAESLFDRPPLPVRENEREKTAPRIAPIFEKRGSERPKTPVADDVDVDMDDLYDATPRAVRPKPSETTISQTNSLFGGDSLFGPGKSAVEEEPPEDELDALFAEEEILQAPSTNTQSAPAGKKLAVAQDGIDDDEMEAMAEMDMDGMW